MITDHGASDTGSATARAILAVLLDRGQAGARLDELVTSVWGEPGGATRDSVYHYISDLRKALRTTQADTRLENAGGRYRLLADPGTVDWHRFRALATQADHDRADPDRAAALLREALTLWHGEPLSDIDGRLEPLRRDMTEQRLAVVEALAEIEARQGRPDAVLRLLRRDVMTGPIRERAAALLMNALTDLGQRDEATGVYRLVRRRLGDELGFDPGELLEAAHRRALQSPGTTLPTPVPAGPPATGARPVSGLPRPDPHFTDRTQELNRIFGAMTAPATVPVCAIYGMGGLGKTALAVRAATALHDAYPDGVVFLDLHGYSEQRDALSTAEILDRLIRRLRIDVAAIPAAADDLAAYYHDLLDGRRLLLVLDNARDAAQVRPVLPRSAGCAAIITSRLRLSALDDALLLPLEVLTPPDAAALLRAVAGLAKPVGGSGDGSAIDSIVQLCGRLPLAIRIVAARLRANPDHPLTELEANLSIESGRLRELEDDDRSVTASLRVSLQNVPGPIARTLALLGRQPGVCFDGYAVAAVADLPYREATRHMRYLADRHLIVDHSPGRFQLHDLVAEFARQHATSELPANELAAALHRLADYYLRTAELADRRITPNRYRIELALLDRPAAVPPMPDYDTALNWLTAEDSNLEAACLAAAAAGLDEVCWQLAYTVRGYYFLAKRWRPWMVTHESALLATRRLGERRGEAMIANNLGLVHLELGEAQLAAGYYERAEAQFKAVGDEHGQHAARANRAWIRYSEGDYQRFLDEMRPVYDFYRRAGSERNAAITLRGIGLAESETGHTTEAIAALTTALEVFHRFGLRLDAVMTYNALGELHQRTGDMHRAVEVLEQAVSLARTSGSTFERGRAHHRLGQIADAAGDNERARLQWDLSLACYESLKAPQADLVRAEIRSQNRGG